MNRRTFLGTGAAGLATVVAAPAAKDKDRINVGVMGTGGRGTGLAVAFSKLPGVAVTHVCDADKARADKAAAAVEQNPQKAPAVSQDFRRILDDKDVDVLVIAACNHWHAIAAIRACEAGKHVYVEKPLSHTPREGELLVKAARKHKRQVQMGNQRRSWDKVREAIDLVRAGEIGRAFHASSWYTSRRDSIGKGEAKPVPEGLDYDLWQGPSTRKPFKSNYLHYTWHWFWHWGNGELGNNGVHMLDLCRWGLGVDYPIRVTSSGGRYAFDDDQETPDTHVVTFDFDGKKSIQWQGHSCTQLAPGIAYDVMFVGEKGTLVIRGGGYSIHDREGKQVKKAGGKSSDTEHLTNFLDAVRGGRPLNSDVEEAHKSTLLCHLGNIAHRVGRSVKCESSHGHVLDDKQAQALWTKEYAKGWDPK